MKSTHTIIIFLLLFLFAPFNQAASQNQTEEEKLKEVESFFQSEYQEEDYWRTDELLITATGSQKPVHLAPSVASVITKEEIEAMGATTLDEILETVPGLHVSSSSTGYFRSIWSIRGMHSALNPHVLMLINGIPNTSPAVGDRGETFKMPVSMISRVEVVRGPGSALYGADAFAGVVNVITKDNHEIDGTKFGFRGGSFDTFDGWAQHGGQYNGWDVFFGIEAQKTQGDKGRIIDQDAQSDAIGNPINSLTPTHLDTRYELLDTYAGLRKDNWLFRIYNSLQETSAGPGGAQSITYGNEVDVQHVLAELQYSTDKLLPDLELTFRAYYANKDIDVMLQYYPTGHVLNWLGNPIVKTIDRAADVTANYTGFTHHNLLAGMGYKFMESEVDQYRNFGAGVVGGILTRITDPSQIYMSPHRRRVWHMLVQDEWNFAKGWELTAGIRHDKYSDFGDTTNPRVALVWETRYDLTTKLMYGQAFRAPSYSEQFNKNNRVAIGSDDIAPEEIETYELAFDYQATNWLRTQLNFFYYKATNLIEFKNGNPPVTPNVATNYGEREGRGFELDVSMDLTKQLTLRSNFSYQRSRDKKNNNAVVPNTPAMQFYLNPNWAFANDWSVDLQYHWVGELHREYGDTRGDVPSYDLVNLTLSRKNVTDDLDIGIGIKNVFNQDALDPSFLSAATAIPNDYPQEGRSIWGELRYSF